MLKPQGLPGTILWAAVRNPTLTQSTQLIAEARSKAKQKLSLHTIDSITLLWTCNIFSFFFTVQITGFEQKKTWGNRVRNYPNILPTCYQTLIIYWGRIIHCAYWRAKSHNLKKQTRYHVTHWKVLLPEPTIQENASRTQYKRSDQSIASQVISDQINLCRQPCSKWFHRF